MEEKKIQAQQIVLIGDSGVGKTSILNRLNGVFTENYVTTIGLDYIARNIPIGESTTTVKLWDTAGQERYCVLPATLFNVSNAVVLVFAVTNRSSFTNLHTWMGLVRERARPDVVTCIIGNKTDLADNRVVSEEEAKLFANAYHMDYFECSAKTGANVEKAITCIVENISKQKPTLRNAVVIPSSSSTKGHKGNRRKKCC